jgi:hypothetical protein
LGLFEVGKGLYTPSGCRLDQYYIQHDHAQRWKAIMATAAVTGDGGAPGMTEFRWRSSRARSWRDLPDLSRLGYSRACGYRVGHVVDLELLVPSGGVKESQWEPGRTWGIDAFWHGGARTRWW